MDQNRSARKDYERNFDKAKGPRKKRLDFVEKDAIKLGVSVWKSLARDRQKWRS